VLVWGLESGLELASGLELELASASVWVSGLALSPALQTRRVHLKGAASVRESAGAWGEEAEQARMGLALAAALQHRALPAEEHHWCRLRSARYPARPFAQEI